MRHTLLAITAALLFALPAFADDVIALPPAGSTIVSLNATERAKLTQDTLNASLRIEQDGANPADIQNKINTAMAAAVTEAKTVAEVKTTTGSYYVYAYDDGIPDPKTGRIVNPVKKWRGTQTIDLESKDAAKLLELTGKIQGAGFVMNGLNYSLSSEKSDEARDGLTTRAIASLRQKAQVATSALGKTSYEIIDMNIDASAPPVYPMYKTMAMSAARDAAAPEAAPTAEAGESEVTLTVSARILVK